MAQEESKMKRGKPCETQKIDKKSPSDPEKVGRIG
jgi:hypothetical protein